MIPLLAQPEIFITAAVILGLLVGSFLNVVIHRLPIMLEREWQEQSTSLQDDAPDLAAPDPQDRHDQGRFDLLMPRSACPHCGHAIRWHENLPVLSYLWLRGRCSGCGQPIGLRYPIVELAGGLLAGLAAWQFGFAAQAVAVVLLWALLALTVIDLDTHLLPDRITQPLIWAGLLVNWQGVFVPLEDALLGAVAGYLVLWLVYHAFRLATGKEGMGYGDFKLLAALGAWLGWQMLPLTLLAASLSGALVGVAMILLAGHDRARPIPFGPWLAAGGTLALFWGEDLLHLYLGP